MRFPDFKAIVDDCLFPTYTLHAEYEGTTGFIHATYDEADTATGIIAEQKTREWVVNLPKATPSEVVMTCFKCIIGSMEHKTREWFTYRYKPVFQPHHDIEKLLSITEERRA